MFSVGGIEVGAISPRFPIHFSVKLRGTTIKSWSEPTGGKQQTQHSVKFETLVRVWESCTRKFSFLRKTLWAVLKD